MSVPSEDVLKRWVEERAVVHATWATGTGTQAVGEVVAYCAVPTLLIRRADGEQVHVALAPACEVTELTEQD